jgi:hypothetical protein
VQQYDVTAPCGLFPEGVKEGQAWQIRIKREQRQIQAQATLDELVTFLDKKAADSNW